MGMYDSVRIEVPLPGEGEKYRLTEDWQTKDFAWPALDVYAITKDGALVAPNGRDMQFHGFLNFYTYTRDRKWFEYNAKFTDGRLVEIQAVTTDEERA